MDTACRSRRRTPCPTTCTTLCSSVGTLCLRSGPPSSSSSITSRTFPSPRKSRTGKLTTRLLPQFCLSCIYRVFLKKLSGQPLSLFKTLLLSRTWPIFRNNLFISLVFSVVTKLFKQQSGLSSGHTSESSSKVFFRVEISLLNDVLPVKCSLVVQAFHFP